MDIDHLVNIAVATAQVRIGTRAEWVSKKMGVKVYANHSSHRMKQPTWSEEEVAYVTQNMGRLSYDEMGEALGRTGLAVKIQQVRRLIPAPSKQPGMLTANGVAKLLGLDIHAILKLQRDRGLKLTVMPGPRGIKLTRIEDLKRWLVKPENWVCFRVERIADPHLQRLVCLAQERWGDEWWRIGDVARYHGVDCNLVNLHIRKGWLAGNDYGNYWVRQSDAIAHRFRRRGDDRMAWSKRGDAFLVKARMEGKTFTEIGRMMKMDAKLLNYRFYKLTKTGTEEGRKHEI